jgi:4-amino-4-deoxy-L-arabinose transferase-like glycosyltransferase
MKRIRYWRPLALFGLALLGLALRLYGLNWDQGNSFHPDEREIMFHVTALSWPHSFAQFLDPVNSPLNPHFFAYGSFPLYLLATLGNVLMRSFPTLGTFANLTLVGRVVNAVFDCGTILLTAWLGLLLADDHTPERHKAWTLAFLAAALVTFTPLQLQLSHFYAVDTMLLFFVTLTILACVALVNTGAPVRWSLVVGLGYGLALATKFSAAPLVVPLLVAVILRWRRHGLFAALGVFFASLATTGLVFLVAMPYALLDWTNFREQVAMQGDLVRGLLDLPYVRQFAGTMPYLYEAQNMLLWGMGVMLGLAALVGFVWLLWRMRGRITGGPWLVVLAWVITYSAIVGSFFVKFMRYMLPIYPFLTLMAAALLVALAYRERLRNRDYKQFFATALPVAAIALVLAGTAFQGLALLNVYSQPNTRIQASRWMYSHLSPGSVLTYEQWDDPLPVPVDGQDPSVFVQATYPDASGQLQTGLDLYGDDTFQKAQLLANLLPKIDCITMATDRLDKSIPRLPQRYPLTIHYYQLLFSGQLGFYLAAQFENHPNLFGVTLNDSNADESYSVFDHPTVRIFVRENPYPYTSDQLLHKLLAGVQLPSPTTVAPPVQQLITGNQQSFPHTAQNSVASHFEEDTRRMVRHSL